jgi:hypothetical protein
MELAVNEQRALESLVKFQRHWRWFRIVGLVAGVGVLAAAPWLGWHFTQGLLDTTRHMSFTESPTGLEVFFASQYGGFLAITLLFPALGGTIIGLVIGQWRGNAVHILLIRVLSELKANPTRTNPGP